jgi:hypothetical protein
MSVRLRFVDTQSNLVSRIIRGAELGVPWSHVEAVTPTGLYLGAISVIEGGFHAGVQARDPSYDKTWTKHLLVDVPATPAQELAFFGFLQSKIGLPYDLEAIAEMAEGALTGEAPDWANADAYICSALVTAALLAANMVFTAPATVRLATPRDVLVMCAALGPIGPPVLNSKPEKMIWNAPRG